MIDINAMLLDELRRAGLLIGPEPQLTDKGFDWLRQLEQVGQRRLVEEHSFDLLESIDSTSR